MLLALYGVSDAPAATLLTKQVVPPIPLPGMQFVPVDLAWTAADVVLGNSFSASNKDILMVWNSHATLDRTVTLKSSAEPTLNRFGDITKTVKAGRFAFLGPITKTGWAQPDGNVYVVSQTVDIMLAACQFI